MNVADRMTKNPFTVTRKATVTNAREMMKKEKIHRLPVIDDRGTLVGIVTEKDILCASPSPATTLDVWEMTSLLAQLKVEAVMTPNPISCAPDVPVEAAARILADNDIGGLPITEDGLLVGIITESDIFEIFIELFACRETGLRVTFLVPDVPGEMASLSVAVRDAGGSFLSFGFVRGENPTNRIAIAKVAGISEERLLQAITPFVQEIRDVRVF